MNELAEPFPVTVQAVSKHLKVLEHAGLITRGRTAQWRPARLRARPLGDATSWLSEYRRFWEQRFDRLDDHLQTITTTTRGEPAMSDATPPEGVVSAHSDAEGILIVRVFDAPRELVFKAWTEAERFAEWFGEHGSEIPLDKVDMDPRPGGEWHATMYHGPDRIEIPFFGEFLEVVEPERIVMTIESPASPTAPPDEVFTVILKDLGDDRTEMTFTQRGGNLPADEYSRAMRGSLIFFERLRSQLKTRHD